MASLIEIPEIIGLPPGNYTTKDIIRESMPIARITPCVPAAQSSMTVFTLEESKDKYLELLEVHGYTMKQWPIKVAFLADNFPTDSFQNEYGESFLNKITDVASQGAGELAQMMGAGSATEAMEKIGTALSGMGEAVGGVTGGALGTAGKIAGGIGTGSEKMIKYLESKKGAAGVAGTGLGLVSKMLAGHRVDFPQVWKNSGFQPSYTMTIRLYNPNPASMEITDKYIVGPICALLILGLPQTEDGSTYNWPFLHKIRTDGIYNLDPSFISNITVIKGGDQQSIAWNQALAIVDIRIDFGSLYNSMVVGKEHIGQNRPTLGNYLSILRVPKYKNVKKGIMYKKEDDIIKPLEEDILLLAAEKNSAKIRPKTNPDTEKQPGVRVDENRKTIAQKLKDDAEIAASGFIP